MLPILLVIVALLSTQQADGTTAACADVRFVDEAEGQAQYDLANGCGYDALVSLSFAWGGEPERWQESIDRIVVVKSDVKLTRVAVPAPFVPEWIGVDRWPVSGERFKTFGTGSECTRFVNTRPGADEGVYDLVNDCATCRLVTYRELYWNPNQAPAERVPPLIRVRLQPKERKSIGRLPRYWRPDIVNSEPVDCQTGRTGGSTKPSYPPPKSPEPRPPLPAAGNRPDPTGPRPPTGVRTVPGR